MPDAATLTDRIYQWIYHGGGHLNGFRSAPDLEAKIAAATGLRPVARRVLHTSLIFMGRHNFRPRPPRKLWLFGGGDLRSIAGLTYAWRMIDRVLGTRLSVYGWALYFGTIGEDIELAAWTNVCVKCGSAQSSASLLANGQVNRVFVGPDYYRCAVCEAWNLFTVDPVVY